LSVYRLPKQDARRAAVVLADAFHDDAMWQAILEDGVTPAQKVAAFETLVVYCHAYGEVWAPSADLEGIIAWLPGRYAKMTTWRMLRSGAILPGLRVGAKLAKKMETLFAPFDRDREAHMKGRAYLYIDIFGVAWAFQGQGHGGTLLRALIAKSDREKLPLYVETQTEGNVRMYTRFGFEVVQEATVPEIDLPYWELVREPAG
jgi:ribosomal protein S18 acetylase RimI-like enzyme